MLRTAKTWLAKFILVVITCNYHTSEAQSQTYLKNLPRFQPNEIFTTSSNRFYLDYGSKIYIVEKKIFRILKLPANKNVVRRYNSVSSNGEVFSLYKSKFKSKEIKGTTVRWHFAKCLKFKCSDSIIREIKNDEDADSVGVVLKSPKGPIFFVLTQGALLTRKKEYFFNHQHVTKEMFLKLRKKYFPVPKSGIVAADSDVNRLGLKGLDFKYQGKIYRGPGEHRYTRSIKYDSLDQPHLFYHDPGDRSFYHSYFSKKDQKIVVQNISHEESGIENSVFIDKQFFWVVFYFYRDNFHKGIAVAKISTSHFRLVDSFVLDAAFDRNTGWEMMGAQTPNGRGILSFQTDQGRSNRETGVWQQFVQITGISNLNY